MDEKLQLMAVDAALSTQKDSLAKRYEKQLLQELNDRWSSNLDNDEDTVLESASVLVVELISPELSELLSNTELTDIVKRAYRSAGDTVNLFSAQHIQLVGERLLAVFHDSEKTVTATHRFNAIRAAFGLVDSVGQIGQHLKVTYAERKLPGFDVRVALHTGPVTIARLTDPLSAAPPMVLALGNTVNLALLLHEQARSSAWLVTASTPVLSGLRADALTIRGKSRITLRKNGLPLDVVELTSLTLSSDPHAS
jgi:class 3 adenylate cyclase